MAVVAAFPPFTLPTCPLGVALYLQASIILAFLAASIAPTPLYALYQARWGFTPITITAVFGIYALAVLAALLTVGSLSDHVGRRPVLLAAILIQAAALVLLARRERTARAYCRSHPPGSGNWSRCGCRRSRHA
jgi:MFS family permease